jgi:hypothetical protein
MKRILISIPFVLLLLSASNLSSNSYLDKEITYLGKFVITSYHAIESECDSTPDIGAYGNRVAINGNPIANNLFASNAFKRGDKIVIPSLSGRKVWVKADTMNPNKKKKHIDLLLEKNKSIGKHYLKVYIVK